MFLVYKTRALSGARLYVDAGIVAAGRMAGVSGVCLAHVAAIAAVLDTCADRAIGFRP
jgi:hypothetical protein